MTHRRPRRRRTKPQAPLPEPIRRFDFLKGMAHFEGALKDCPRKECKKRRQCCGGPRGTMRRQGFPFCRSEAVVTKAEHDRWFAGHVRGPKRSHGNAWAAEKLAEFMGIEKVK